MIAPRVRAVVVNWNGEEYLARCLDSLLAQELPEGTLEVVVVDNASTDGSAALLAERYPQVKTLMLPTNTGFAGGVAAATEDILAADWIHVSIEDTRAAHLPEFVALLNNDATFEPDAIAHLLECLTARGNERVGAATATMLLASPEPASGPGPGPDRAGAVVNSTGNIVTRWGAAHDRDLGVPLADLPPERKVRNEVFGFCGGAALIRTGALYDVGGFDASLFLYYEDTDFSWRLHKRGLTVLHEPAAVAHHRHMASTDGGTNATFRFYNTRNSLIVAARYAPWPVVVRAWARQTCGALARSIRRGEPRPIRRARLRGLAAAARAMPGALRARRRR